MFEIEMTQKRIDVYIIEIVDKIEKTRIKDRVDLSNILENFLQDYTNDYEYSKSNIRRKYWLQEWKKQDNCYEILINFTEYNRRVRIVDVETKGITKEKDFSEGDLEKQHFMIYIDKYNNVGLLLHEYLRKGMHYKTLEKMMREYVIQNYQQDAIIAISPIVSKNIVDEIRKLKKISLLKIILDKNKLPDIDLLFSERDISRNSVELVFKARKKYSFTRDNVLNYINKNKFESNRIDRIVIEGKTNSGDITIDTDNLKVKKTIDVKLDKNKQVDTKDIFNKMSNIIKEEYANDIWNILLNEEGEQNDYE